MDHHIGAAVRGRFNQIFRRHHRQVADFRQTAELLLEVNLGATAIGTRLNTPEGYQHLAVQRLAEVSNLPVVPAEDLIEATSDCGAYVMASALC